MEAESTSVRSIASRCALFAGVPSTVVDRALADLEMLEFSPGERVLIEATSSSSDQDSGIYILLGGQLLASRAMPDGRTQILSTMSPGEFFGELAGADDGRRSATVSAVTPVVVGRLAEPVLERLVTESPRVMRTIAAAIARRLRAADEARLAARLNEERLSVVGRAAAMLVHDLKNPLGVVRNASELIASGIGDARACAAKSKDAADFMLAMVKDLLEYARGDRSYAQAPVRLGEVVEDVDSFGLAPLEAAGTVVVQRKIGEDATLLGDRRAISRALLNIVRNAAEAMPAGGTLTFESAVGDGQARFIISDTGPGIPERILPMLFEPFATHGKSGGTGLGMAMTKAAIDGHGGTIAVDTAIGRGTTFTVVLPLVLMP